MDTLNSRWLTWLRSLCLITDVGFVAYWLITALHAIPDEYLFSDYEDPRLVQWNWSFIFLDLAISATGFSFLALERMGSPKWGKIALISLTLTSCSGLQAIGYWVVGLEFALQWWIPNLFLLLYPIPFIIKLLEDGSSQPRTAI